MNDNNGLSSITSEAGIVATLFHEPKFCYGSENLKPSQFSDVFDGCIYEAIITLVRGKGIDKIDSFNVYEAIQNSDSLRSRWNGMPIERLIEFEGMSTQMARNSQEEYDLLADTVINCAFKREMLSALKRCEGLCYQQDNGSDAKKKIYSEIDTILTDYAFTEDVKPFDSVIDECWAEIEEDQQGGGGIPFDYPELNKYVTISKGELIIFGGRAKEGKSILMLNIAVSLLKRGLKVLYLDSEIADKQFLLRLVAHLSQVKYRNIKAGAYNEEEKSRIYQSLAWLKGQGLFHKYLPILSAEEIYTSVKSTYDKYGVDVIILDYIKAPDNADAFATYAELGNITNVVKNEIAGVMDIPAIAAVQLTDAGKVADSARIKRNASTIITIEAKDPNELAVDGPNGGNKKMRVEFNRDGAQQTKDEYISMEFDGDHITYRQAKEQHIPDMPY